MASPPSDLDAPTLLSTLLRDRYGSVRHGKPYGGLQWLYARLYDSGRNEYLPGV